MKSFSLNIERTDHELNVSLSDTESTEAATMLADAMILGGENDSLTQILKMAVSGYLAMDDSGKLTEDFIEEIKSVKRALKIAKDISRKDIITS